MDGRALAGGTSRKQNASNTGCDWCRAVKMKYIILLHDVQSQLVTYDTNASSIYFSTLSEIKVQMFFEVQLRARYPQMDIVVLNCTILHILVSIRSERETKREFYIVFHNNKIRREEVKSAKSASPLDQVVMRKPLQELRKQITSSASPILPLTASLSAHYS